ncbi:hypothetical protein B5M43_012795 [Microbacterium sp. MEC084]|uniref:hypothetical protein n=1 Tax=Microbacterium sp. MEC084 TaxID=1963027 RepID=UPI00106FDE1A|nr:hypothetical protein [Microbacterium sp. MEC084]MCD1269703.1 hypothetical protein [Microbacterium sp. MEC084]
MAAFPITRGGGVDRSGRRVASWRREGSLPRAAVAVLAAAACSFVLVLVALRLPVQVSMVCIGMMAAVILGSRTGIVALVVVLVPTLGLVRRLVSGGDSGSGQDPLLVLPSLLVLSVVFWSVFRPQAERRSRMPGALVLGTIVGAGLSFALSGQLGVEPLYYAAVLVLPLCLAYVISTGQLPDVWGTVRRLLPPLGFLVGTYGLFQFFVLPQWDRNWMRASGLTSIGAPEPLQVRLFGASESPGPYSLFIGTVVVLCLVQVVVETRVGKRLAWASLGAYLLLPLVLSGVRSALIGVAICALLLALIRARGFKRVLVVAFLAGGYYVLTSAIGRFGATSSILSADRYTDLSNDASLAARLDLLQYLREPWRYVLGNPAAPTMDNLFIDVLVRFGLIAAVCMVLLVGYVGVVAVRNLVSKQREDAALAAMFIAIATLFGPVFNSTFGILIGIIFGTVMASSKVLGAAADGSTSAGKAGSDERSLSG